MSHNLNNKRIIMIHGLASKPKKEVVHDLWKKCVIENIKVDSPELAKELSDIDSLFKSAYWADAVPHHIPDDNLYVKKLKVQVDGVIKERKRIKNKFHVGIGEEVGAFFKNRGLDLVKLLAGALAVKDDVMRTFLRETELYANDQYIADQMRFSLENELRDAWDNNCEVVLLSHSMGTFIAYDVLWRFSHRNVDGYKQYKNKKVKMFVTMGSPLGDETIRDMLFAKHHKKKGVRQYPTNIEHWHNYACLGDVVSHCDAFEDDFFAPMKTLNVFPDKKRFRAIDYNKLHNPFIVVSHGGNKGKEKRNPHKSYGYLCQPRLGTWLTDFLNDKLR